MRSDTERRASARVAVPLHVTLHGAGGEVVLPVRDVSLGGIFLYTGTPPGPVGTRVVLTLAVTAGILPLQLEAEVARVVLRSKETGGGILGVGLQFVGVDEALREQLAKTIDRAMLGPGTDARAYPRVYFLLQVVCKTRNQLRAMARDVGEGGVGLIVDRRMEQDEEVTVALSNSRGPELAFRGWVVSCLPTSDPPGHFRLGVRFARLSSQERADLRAFLRSLYRR